MAKARSNLVPANRVGFIRTAMRMFSDPSVPAKHKLILLIGAWYWAVPEPTDLIPLVGWLDEAGVTGWFTVLLVLARSRYRTRKPV
jgi:uncharacterized membrane protein YkvA (DUF1232 family)